MALSQAVHLALLQIINELYRNERSDLKKLARLLWPLSSTQWLKAKVSEVSAFVVTGYIEGEAVAVAALRDGELAPAGLVKFGLAGKGLWEQLERLRAGPATRSGLVPVRPELVAGVRYFGRYRSGAIRDGVLLSGG